MDLGGGVHPLLTTGGIFAYEPILKSAQNVSLSALYLGENC